VAHRIIGLLTTAVVSPFGSTLPGDGSAKQNAVLSVGRFSTSGHRKKHPELIRAFGDLRALRDGGWSYECLGGLGVSEADQSYFRTVQTLAADCGVNVRVNLTRNELTARYSAAKIFIHGVGYGEPDDKPEMAEHFGISTVEAMAAGCVPIVINKGAQPEIVEHGVSGFLWNTLTELKSYMATVGLDDTLREQMSTAARRRAAFFGRERFVTQITSLLNISLEGERGTN
jgi:glycosyltransferase involved in cell wall biosynthesis